MEQFLLELPQGKGKADVIYWQTQKETRKGRAEAINAAVTVLCRIGRS